MMFGVREKVVDNDVVDTYYTKFETSQSIINLFPGPHLFPPVILKQIVLTIVYLYKIGVFMVFDVICIH